MRPSDTILKICSSLQSLGFEDASAKIQEAVQSSSDDPLSVVSLALKEAVLTEKNTKYEKCLRISKMGEPVDLDDLLPYKVRQLDVYSGKTA